MKLVYIAHALRGDWEGGIHAAKEYAFAAACAGYLPVVPYVLLNGILDDSDPKDRVLGMRLDTDQLLACSEIWLCGNTVSPGMRAEADIAYKHGLFPRRLLSVDDVRRVTT
jgi:hypothetical protein